MNRIFKFLFFSLTIFLSIAYASENFNVRAYLESTSHAKGGIKIFAFNDNTLISSSRFDNVIKIWNINDRTLLKSIYLDATDDAHLHSVCFRNNSILALQKRNNDITRIYEISGVDFTEKAFTDIPIASVNSLCAKNSSEIILLSTNYLNIIDINSYATTYKSSIFEYNNGAYHPFDKKFIVFNSKGEFKQYKFENGTWKNSINTSVSFVSSVASSVAYSPNGMHVAVGNFGLGLKILSDDGMREIGKWESISAGNFNTDRLLYVAWLDDKRIISAGEGEPWVRSLNNRGILSGAVSRLQNPLNNITSMVRVNETLIAGDINGNVQHLTGDESRYGELFGRNSSLLPLNIQFSSSSDYDFVTSFGQSNVIKTIDPIHSQYRSEYKYIPKEEVFFSVLSKLPIFYKNNTYKNTTLNCNNPLISNNTNGVIYGELSPNGPFLKLDQQEQKFENWNVGDFFWNYCVDKSQTYVALAANSGVYLYNKEKKLNWHIKTAVPPEKVYISTNRKFVVVQNPDFSLDWRNFNDGRLLWSSFVTQSEWLIVLPSGYFSGSSKAHKLLKYRIDDKNSKFWNVDADNFYDVFFRPDLVAESILNLTSNLTPKKNELNINNVISSAPPKITLSAVSKLISVSKVPLFYEVAPEAGGIAEVRIFHNGKLISSDGTYKDAPGKAYAPVGGKNAEANQYADAQRSIRNAGFLEPANSAAVNQVGSLRNQLIVRGAPEKKCNPCKGEIEIDVIPGEENTVSVVAFNRDNTIQSVPASVTFKSTLPKEEPHLWLLSVGINQFQGITPLVNAKKDALDFACTYAGKAALTKLGLNCSEAGRAQSLFKPQNIHVVDALLDAKATKANIQGALDKIASQAKPGDTFVWFVASHGMMDANSLFGIVAHDTKCLNDKCTDISGHITSNEILEASKKIKAMKQLMVLDTCHSGGLDSKMSGLYDARMSLLAKNMGLHMYASAQATEQAQDGVPGSNGTFTAQLLEGIKGAAPKNSDGFISVMTLGQYAKQKTIEATQSKGGANAGKAVQTPVIQHFGLDAGLVGVR